MITCPVLEELGHGYCASPVTTRVHDVGDDGSASILSCDEHVPLARAWVRHSTGGGLAAESHWPKPVSA